MNIQPGQIFRDTYYDNDPAYQGNRKRTIRILSQEPDGRWLAEAVTNGDGSPAKGRKTRLKASTVESGYERVGDAGRRILKVGKLPEDIVEAIWTAEYGGTRGE